MILPLRKWETTRSYKRSCASETYCNTNCDCGCPCGGDFCHRRGYVNSCRSYRRNKTEFGKLSVIISIIFAMHIAVTTANIMGDECDWFGR
jgi:hypothetical protein